MLLMLIEDLYLEGIYTYYANTDGITVVCPNDKLEALNKIWKEWEIKLNMSLEDAKFSKSYIRDTNNFINIKTDKSVKLKGAYEYTGYLEKYGEFDLTGSFDKPIVSYAVVKYFSENIPIQETILNHIKNYPKDGIYDFCVAKKVSKQFTNELYTINSAKIDIKRLQQSVRYYVSNSNQKLFKSKLKNDKELLSLVKRSQRKHKTTSNNYVLLDCLDDDYFYLGYVNTPLFKGYLHVVKHKIFFPNPKKEWLHYDEFEAGKNITLFNDYFETDDYNIDYDYYVHEAQKLIDAIEKNEVKKIDNNTQLKLF